MPNVRRNLNHLKAEYPDAHNHSNERNKAGSLGAPERNGSERRYARDDTPRACSTVTHGLGEGCLSDGRPSPSWLCPTRSSPARPVAA